MNIYNILRNKTNGLLTLILLAGLFVSANAMAQTAASSDLDRLYQKYKGNTETTIFVGDKEVNARVLINYNSHNKPYRIIIYGEAVADADMEELIDQLTDAKVKAGYKRSTLKNVVNFDQNGIYENNIDVATFQKGTQYAKYGIKKMEARNLLVAENGTPKYSSDFFYFEVGDSARKRNLKPEKFDF